MTANVQSMAYVGTEPWHGLGIAVQQGVKAHEMLHAAGLDWRVVTRPARGAKPTRKRHGQDIYSRYEVVRLPRPERNEEEVVFGIVTDRYEPLQNHEAFEFFDLLVDRKMAFFETAGALGQGERVWIMARMPDPIAVVPGDQCHKYLLLSNTHTGRGAVTVKFTAVRVVCQNTLILAMEDGQQAFRVRHSKIMTDRLRQIAELIFVASAVCSKAAQLFRRLTETKLSDQVLEKYLEFVFPRTDAQKKKDKIPSKWIRVRNLLEQTADLQMDGVKGTLWAAYNAITRLEDYRMIEDEVAEARLNRVWFGSSANVKLMALQAAAKLAEAN